jgi:cytochrome c oxidase subunit II
VGRTATIIAVFYGVLVVGSLAVAFGVWRSTRTRARSADTALLERGERTWFAVSVVLLTSLLFATIFFTPFGKGASARKQVVEVTGLQFAWVIKPSAVRARAPVEFRLTSVDVSHAFAVDNDRDELLFQVQVVPGKTQKAYYTFKKPGTYEVLCFEFCGFAHDTMKAAITVKPA